MKHLFENWRKYLRESESGMREFVFSESELAELNRSISKIVSAAKSTLGADGPSPILSAKSLEKIKLDKSQKDPTPLKMVAEQDADVIDLRQRYYGPGGELEKSSPRAVKGLEKGLGQMSAQEFEETGYVMKVPQEVLEDFNVLVESTKKTGDLYEQARDWYHNIRELLNQETNNDRDAALLGLLIAVYSPRAKFALNLAEASFMYKAVQEDAANNPELLREYLETFQGAEKKEPGTPHGFTGAHKVPNFALNLIAPELAGERDKDTGKVKYNDMYEWNSTIDTWMIDAFYPMLRKASTAKEWDAIKGKLMSNVVSYRYMARLVAQQARKFNLLPHELQAIIWVSMQVRQTGEAGLGVTTQFAFNQIKDAIVNIRTINNDLESAKKELEEKSWLGTLFDEIDNKGFGEAAKFLLGIKNEKGKVVVPGIRSITASGKKGSAYQYYTPPEKDSQEKSTLKTNKKPAVKKAPRPKPVKRFADPKYSELKTFYVMNEVIQMPTGKFNNLYDAIILYLDPEFSTEKAVEYITGRFDPEATASSKYFKEEKFKSKHAPRVKRALKVSYGTPVKGVGSIIKALIRKIKQDPSKGVGMIDDIVDELADDTIEKIITDLENFKAADSAGKAAAQFAQKAMTKKAASDHRKKYKHALPKIFKEEKMLQELAAGYSPHNPGQLPLRPGIGAQVLPPAVAATAGSAGEKIPRDADDSEQVAKAVVHRNSHVLLLQNDQGWDLPGGHCKRGENISKGLQREIFEETGLTCGPEIAKLHLNKKNKHFFAVELPSDDIHLSDEHTDHKIVPFEEALRMVTNPTYREAIQRASEIIRGGQSLRSRDDSARLTLTPDGSRQERAPHAPMRRQTRDLAEAMSRKEVALAHGRLTRSPIGRLVAEIQIKVIDALEARYCVSVDRSRSINCFVKDAQHWINGKGDMPSSIRTYANYFNLSVATVAKRIKNKHPGLSTRKETIELMADEYVREILPKIQAALDTPVQVMLPKVMTMSAEGSVGKIPYAAHFVQTKAIGIRGDIEAKFQKEYKTDNKQALKKFIFYALRHEFYHTLDRELRVSGKRSFLDRAAKIGSERVKGYYAVDVARGKVADEFYAELQNLISSLNGLPTKKDIKHLCILYRKYPGDMIHQRIKLKVLRGYEITDIDYMIQSPLMRSLINCQDEAATYQRFKVLAHKLEKRKQLEERRKRK